MAIANFRFCTKGNYSSISVTQRGVVTFVCNPGITSTEVKVSELQNIIRFNNLKSLSKAELKVKNAIQLINNLPEQTTISENKKIISKAIKLY